MRRLSIAGALGLGCLACRGGGDETVGARVARALAAPPASAALATAAVSAAANGILAGYRVVEVGGVATAHHGHVVFLVDRSAAVAVPIFVGETEAISIELRLDGKRYPRPLTHDLYDATLARLGGEVHHVSIDRLEAGTFHATVTVTTGTQRFSLDARASDAIALALGRRAPIHLAERVIDEAGLELDELGDLHRGSRGAPARPAREADPPLHL